MRHNRHFQGSLRGLKHRLENFGRRDDGSISIETLLIFPLLAWALLGTVTFTDAFRHQSTLLRSTYTVSDLVASSTLLEPSDIDGFATFLQNVSDPAMNVRLRVSLIGWDSQEEEHRVVWSNGVHAGAAGDLDDTALNEVLAVHVPIITQGETLVVTETWLDYEPVFRIGLQPRTMSEVAVMRPRFAPGIHYADPNAPPPPTAWCEFIVDACGM